MSKPQYTSQGRATRWRSNRGAAAVRDKYANRSEREDPRRSQEQIEYIADLLLELKEIAHSNHLSTLAGILELAHAEARIRAKDCR
ncbi:hypothetical protein [Hyphomicrobium sp. CS1GBMeth3]|uniref:hypothetical protein n=1 Tax=Hyphomicrobium sp. CS1GBMeth3 TaxID=1892845 RepID=UPI000AEC5976|nr:hypothetical protein [Hyphomicrobium sp. CS1GBMeth3]